MFKNYLLIAVRNLLRQKGFSAINITGLSVGMACSILILLWVSHELSYNRFNEKADRLYRLVQTQHYVSGPLTTTCMPGLIAKDLQKDIPEISNSFMYYVVPGIVSYGDKVFREDVRLADPALWDMFSFTFLKGDKMHVFDEVNSAVITDKFASKYFGGEDPIGKVLTFNDEHLFKVTGVICETPSNSTFRFDVCTPFEYIRNLGFTTDEYGWNTYYSYVELAPGTDYRKVNEKINNYLMDKTSDPAQVDSDPSNAEVDLFLFPLKDVYLHSFYGKGGNITYVYIFSLIAVFILIIACINFMNLSTARAARRSREIGLRKVCGANRQQIILQFIGESLLITFLAFLAAILIVYIFLPGFNSLSGKTLSLDWSNIGFIGGLVAIFFFVGIVSGSYPAFYLSSLQPVKVLKNGAFKGSKGYNFRRILVVFQFFLSITMMICTIVVYRQLAYIDRKDLGMDRENVIFAEMMGKTSSSYKELKNMFLQNPSILSVTRAGGLPFDIGSNSGGYNWEGKETNDEVLIGFGFTDLDYINTLGMKMVAGRFFEDGYATDTSSAVVINETAARIMGMDDPVGKWVTWDSTRYSIIGVIEDFHFLPMTEEISPLFLFDAPQYSSTLFVKVNGNNTDQTVEYMQEVWEKTNPGFPFEYRFLDAAYDELYMAEDRLGKIFKYFSILTILISCLGLFGLAAFLAEQRTKEIGVRKILGAGISQIIATLAGSFLKWVVLANIIAWPVTYFIMTRWLEGYAYHTKLSVWIFLTAAIISLSIALATVSFQTLRAAARNPVNSIKYE
jgi:ABC-type antimicrobial peptide transport system permease subunit